MRIDLERKPALHVQTEQFKINGVVRTNTAEAMLERRYFERSDITVVPRDATGFRKPSPYKGKVRVYDPPSVESSWHSQLDDRGVIYTVNDPGLPFAQMFGNVLAGYADWENSLKTQALRSIKDQRVNLSMTLAFLPQTLRMIRGNFSTISSVLHAARRQDWRNVGRLLKVDPKKASSFYLEVLFGWLQLLRDTQGIVEELHRKCNKPHHTYVYGRVTRAQEVPPIAKWARPYRWTFPGDYIFNGDRKVEHRLVMIYRGETALLSRMAQLGLTNPLELLWDLVPWSWVVNMGISIGDFLATLDATIGLTYLGGSYTRYSRVAGPVVVEKGAIGGRFDWTLDARPGFYEQVDFDRRSINDKIDPFVLKNPFGAPLALTTAVIAAVVQQGRKATPQPPSGSTRSIYRKRGTRNLPPITYRP